MNKKIYQRILKVGSIISLLTIFVLFEKLFFPYVSSKQLTFNILIEVLMVFWLVYIIKYKEERPRLRALSWSLIAFFIVILASVFVSIDPQLSFWGKTERMLGFVNVVHFLAFYLIIITVFKKFKDFKVLLSALLVSGLAVSIAILINNNPNAIIGNTAYTAGFLLFSIYISIYLFFVTKTNWRYVFIAPLLLIFPAFILLDITGSVIALGLSGFIALIAITILYKRLWLRLMAGFLAFIIVLTIFVSFTYPDKSWIKNNSILSQISWQKNTFQTRLVGWKAAFECYKERPILGSGYNTFSYTFDKYFDADFYNHSKSETYFDRAHNNLLDVASTMGTIGLSAYLMIMISTVFYFVKIYIFSRRKEKYYKNLKIESESFNVISTKGLSVSSKKQKKLEKKLRRENKEKTGISNKEYGKKLGFNSIFGSCINFNSSNNLLAIIALFALLVAYFVQNLAIFDTFVTYLALMIFLAFIRFLYINLKDENRELKSKTSGEVVNKTVEQDNNLPLYLEYILLIVFIIIVGSFMYKLNISTLVAHNKAVKGYYQVHQGEAQEGLNNFIKAMNSSTPLQKDPRIIFNKLILNGPQVLAELNVEEKIEYYKQLILLNDYNLENSSNYHIYLLNSSQLSNEIADLYKKIENETEFKFYKEKALKYINDAIKASPERIKQYWLKGKILIDLGEKDLGLEQWQKSIDLNKEFNESYCQYAQAYLIVKEDKNAWEQMDKCITSDGIDNYDHKSVLELIVKHYRAEGDFNKAIKAYSRYAELVNSVDVWQSLAELYTQEERWQDAKISAQKAYELVVDEKKKNSIKVFLDIVEKKLHTISSF